MQSATNNDGGGGGATSLAATFGGNVTAGNAVFLWVKHEGAATTITGVRGAESLTPLTKTTHANTDFHGQWLYLLASTGGGATVTANFAALRTWIGIIALEYSYTASPISFDQENGGSGTSTAPATGNVTTTGTSELALVGYGEYSANFPSAELINGTTPETIVDMPGGVHFSSVFAHRFGATFTGQGQATLANEAWIFRIATFKEAGGAAAAPVRLKRQTLLGVG